MYSVKNKKNSYHAFFYGLMLLGIIFLSGCSSTKTISRTYKEYIPSIEPEQQQCILDYKNHRNDCQTVENNILQSCKQEAKLAAQDSYHQALNDYQRKVEQIGGQKIAEEQEIKNRRSRAKNEYDQCLANEKMRKEKLDYSAFHAICTPPRIDNNYYSSNKSSSDFYVRKPREQDFTNDAHCYTGNECENFYDAKYLECGGKIIFTTWCFANCEGDN
ncbi:MAG: hypothetical protein V3V00_12045 [Saprospiraceae bacterium]